MLLAGRRTRIVGGALLVCVLVFGAAGCASSDSEVDSLSATQGLPSTQVDLEANHWLLVHADSSLKTADNSAVTLVVDNDRVAGTGPCNAYNADIHVNDDSVEIAHLASTKKLCKPVVMQSEKEYFATLQAVDTVDVDDDSLVLSNNDPDVRLEFHDFDPRDHLTGKWSIINVIDQGALQTVRSGTQPTIAFANDDSVVLVTGCNDASTTWTLEDDLLTFEPARQTQKGCPTPPGVMEQEVALTKALEAAHSVDISPTTLTILNKQGDIVLVATK